MRSKHSCPVCSKTCRTKCIYCEAWQKHLSGLYPGSTNQFLRRWLTTSSVDSEMRDIARLRGNPTEVFCRWWYVITLDNHGVGKGIRRPLKVVYPSVNGTKNLYYKTCNTVLNDSPEGPPVVIMWSTLTKPSAQMQQRKKEWRPNHFVPIVPNATLNSVNEALSPIHERSAGYEHRDTDSVHSLKNSVQSFITGSQEQTNTHVTCDSPTDLIGRHCSTPKEMWETVKRKGRSRNSSSVYCDTVYGDISVDASNRFQCLVDSGDSEDSEDSECHDDIQDSGDSIEQEQPAKRQRKLGTSPDTSCVTQNSVTERKVSENLHPLPGGKALQPADILQEIVGEANCVKKVPCGNKSNVFVILDNEENRNLIRNKKVPIYWDDCGAWDYKTSRSIKTRFLLGETEADGGHKVSHVIVKDSQVFVEVRDKGKKVNKLLEPQPQADKILTFHRYYSVLKSDQTYKRRITWVEGLPADFPGFREAAIVEYTGEYRESQAPHGNSKHNKDSYERTDPEVMKKIKEKVEHQTPSDVYQEMTNPDLNTTADHPRDLRQCQNAKATATKKVSKCRTNNMADELLDVIQMLSDEHPFVAEIIHSRGCPLPNIICYTKEQLEDFRSFLLSQDGVVGVDRTFSLGKCFVTTTVYKSHKVVKKSTGEPPILLGPIFLHWDGKQENYFKFFAHVRSALGIEIKNVEMKIGSDDEKALTNAIDLAFPGIQRRVCSKHIKDNVLRQMTDKIPKSTGDRNYIANLLFGENGVARADESAVFDERNVNFKETLLEKNHGDFLEYYENYVEDKLSEYIQTQDGRLWTNNNTESLNHRFKVLLQWKQRKANELVNRFYDLVKTQTVDLRRALYGTGNFALHCKYARMKISKLSWSGKSEEEKRKYFLKFLKAGSETATKSVTSSDGRYKVGKVPRLAKKPYQKTRCRPSRTPRK